MSVLLHMRATFPIQLGQENHDSCVERARLQRLLSQASSAAATTSPSDEAEGALQDSDLHLELGLGLGLGSGSTKKEGEGDHKGHKGTPQLDSSHTLNIAGLGSSASKKWMKHGFSETMAMLAPKSSEIDTALSKQSSFFPTWAPMKPTIPAWKSGGLDKPGNVTPHKPFTSTDNCQAQGTPQASHGRDTDLLANGSDFVLTYEDKDGDWMLVGDMPWSMFVSRKEASHNTWIRSNRLWYKSLRKIKIAPMMRLLQILYFWNGLVIRIICTSV